MALANTIIHKMPFTSWVVRTWQNCSANAKVWFALLFFLFLSPFYLLWLPVDFIIGLISKDKREGFYLDTNGITETPKPVSSKNWDVMCRLIVMANQAIKDSQFGEVPTYGHAFPKMGERVYYPPNGTELYKNAKGDYILTAYGSAPRGKDGWNGVELSIRFGPNGNVKWINSTIRVYDQTTGFTRPYIRQWVMVDDQLVLNSVKIPTEQHGGYISHEIYKA